MGNIKNMPHIYGEIIVPLTTAEQRHKKEIYILLVLDCKFQLFAIFDKKN